ncbi:15553_t:CDS:2 [Funneliformis mosseae]|uniref:15553_t:CDS:1 n=1 Tax=Funneliformis mosseae TaxID=27381 RepID=A0A9N8WHF3_FUNMO|nr:15553_t:CDS:2 [Funneliformis mosseae]
MGNQQSYFDTLIHGNECGHNHRRTHRSTGSTSSLNSAFHHSSNSRHYNPKDCCAVWKAIKSILGIWTTGNKEIDEIIKETQRLASKRRKPWKWIPYERFEDVKLLAKGGYGHVYSAMCTEKEVYGRVALKSLDFSENISSEYLQKLRTQIKFEHSGGLIRIYGITKDPVTNNYMLVMKYAKCNLRQYVNKYFTTFSLSNKIELLVPISDGLRKIHQAKLIHGNFHPGNILQTIIPMEKNYTPKSWSCISDLGLHGPASNVPRKILTEKTEFVEEPLDDYTDEDNLIPEKQKKDFFSSFTSTPSRRNSTYEKPKVYGVLPYIAPEVLRGQKFTQSADVYAFGFIIYEVFMGHPPYFDVPHDFKLAQKICQGHRPEISSSDMPQRVKKLITSCWDSKPENRPSAQELHNMIRGWYWRLDPEMKSLMIADDEAFRGTRSSTPVSVKDGGYSTPPTPGSPISSCCYPQTPFTTPLINTSISSSYSDNFNSPTSMSTMNSWNLNGYKVHPEAVYTSRLLEYDNLPNISWFE